MKNHSFIRKSVIFLSFIYPAFCSFLNLPYPVFYCILHNIRDLSTQDLNSLYFFFRKFQPHVPILPDIRPYMETECGATALLIAAISSPFSPLTEVIDSEENSVFQPRNGFNRDLSKFFDHLHSFVFGPYISKPNIMKSIYGPYHNDITPLRLASDQIKRIKCLFDIPVTNSDDDYDDSQVCASLLTYEGNRGKTMVQMTSDRFMVAILLPTLDHIVTIERYDSQFFMYQANILSYNLRNYLKNEEKEYPFSPMNSKLSILEDEENHRSYGGKVLLSDDIIEWFDQLDSLIHIVEAGDLYTDERSETLNEQLFYSKMRPEIPAFDHFVSDESPVPHITFSVYEVESNSCELGFRRLKSLVKSDE